MLQEVGIAAQAGAYRHPASWGDAGLALNLAIQTNWYRAVCQAATATKVAGIYFWNVRIHANPGHEDPQQGDRLTFVDRPAQDAIRDCYATLGS